MTPDTQRPVADSTMRPSSLWAGSLQTPDPTVLCPLVVVGLTPSTAILLKAVLWASGFPSLSLWRSVGWARPTHVKGRVLDGRSLFPLQVPGPRVCVPSLRGRARSLVSPDPANGSADMGLALSSQPGAGP